MDTIIFFLITGLFLLLITGNATADPALNLTGTLVPEKIEDIQYPDIHT